MNRHDRRARKSHKNQGKVMEFRMISADRIGEQTCAWDGCKEGFPIDGPVPDGWRILVSYSGPDRNLYKTIGEVCMSSACDLDIAFCPNHADSLKSLLYENIRTWGELQQPPQGNA